MFQFRKKITISTIFAGLLSPVIAHADLNSAVGLWNIPDDKTGVILSQVDIRKDKTTELLTGSVVTIFPVLGQNVNDRCVKCEDDLKNKPILGMTIISGMEADSTEALSWKNGNILDPKSGNIYHAKMWLTDSGCSLHLRGFIGMPMFGRTEVWTRADDKSCAVTQTTKKDG